MINKKNLLGKRPDELGTKDAIHTAIVAVRAGEAIEPGQRCSLNKFNEAIHDNHRSVGVADPFLKSTILRGQSFWLLLCQDEVPNVRHVWEHPTVDFSPPTREATKNGIIDDVAKALGVTYEQIMEAADSVVKHDRPLLYPGTLTTEQYEEALDTEVEMYDFWSEWSSETLHEFENYGSACCPEYEYPDRSLFRFSSQG